MKLFELYCKVFERYKIILYGFISLIIYLNHMILFWLFLGLTVYEFLTLIISLKKANFEMKQNSNDIVINQSRLALDNKKEDLKIYKLKLKEKGIK